MYYHFAKWQDEGLWHKLNKHLRRKLRKQLGRNEEPSAGCADSQSVKAGSLHKNGFDGAKSVNGSKRHLLVDMLGLVLAVAVTDVTPLKLRATPELAVDQSWPVRTFAA